MTFIFKILFKLALSEKILRRIGKNNYIRTYVSNNRHVYVCCNTGQTLEERETLTIAMIRIHGHRGRITLISFIQI